MKKHITILVFAHILVGCTSNPPYPKSLVQDFENNSTKEEVSYLIEMCNSAVKTDSGTHAIGLAKPTTFGIKYLESQSYGSYYPSSEEYSEFLWLINTNENWELMIFDPYKKPPEIPNIECIKITDYVFWMKR